MKLKAIYDKKEEIPAAYVDLYEERDGKWHLTQIEGMSTAADVSRLQTALNKEKNEHKETKVKLADATKILPEGKTFEDIQTQLDRIPELEEAAKGKIDETKMNDLVETRIKSRMAPVQRELDQAKTKLAASETENNSLKGEKKVRTIHDAVRAELVKNKVQDTAQDDALMYAERHFDIDDSGNVTTRDGVGVTPGLKVADWLSEMQPKKPHWWPPSSGGGGKGGQGGGAFGDNPWAKDSWNMTKQGQIERTQGIEMADRMARAAGLKDRNAIHPVGK